MSVFRRWFAALAANMTGLIDRHAVSWRYRAERHYMRGPGPACERKKSNSE
jgi:hypothetical protein